MTAPTETIKVKGRPIKVQAARIDNKHVIATGNLIRVARLKEEWDEDVDDPEALVRGLKSANIKADLFTFAQRLPDSSPRYRYSMEWDNIAALPVKSYDHWFKEQLHPNHRNKVRIAINKGVLVKTEDFSDQIVTRIKEIYDESPIRQGGIFRDYRADVHTFKRELATYLHRADFLCAYYNNELIGYIKLVYTPRFARTMGILSKIRHRDKAPTNILIAEAVRICADKRIPFLVYGKFRYGYGRTGSNSLMDFKHYNGFESVVLPRYYIPLTTLGNIVLRLNLHRGVVGIAPEPLIRLFLYLRSAYHIRRYG